MGAKAVYNNQSVMIYITGADADLLLDRPFLHVQLFLGKVALPGATVVVFVADETRTIIRDQVKAERDAIQAVKDQLKAVNPAAASNPSRRRDERRKRAKRAHSADVPD